MFILNRIKEPSTWAGVGGLMPATQAVILDHRNPWAWLGLAGAVLAIVCPERKGVAAPAGA